MTGQRFGLWTVLGMTRKKTTTRALTACHCRCDCGTERVVFARSLRIGKSTSCSCASKSHWRGAGSKAARLSSAPSEPVRSADDWMFGAKGAVGLFVTWRPSGD